MIRNILSGLAMGVIVGAAFFGPAMAASPCATLHQIATTIGEGAGLRAVLLGAQEDQLHNLTDAQFASLLTDNERVSLAEMEELGLIFNCRH